MKNYELFLVLSGKMSEEEYLKMLDKVKAILTENKAEVINIDKWGKKKLAYPIKYQSEGYCTVMSFKAPTTTIPDVEPKLRIIEDIFRAMFTVK